MERKPSVVVIFFCDLSFFLFLFPNLPLHYFLCFMDFFFPVLFSYPSGGPFWFSFCPSASACVYVMVLVLPFDHHMFFIEQIFRWCFLSQSCSSPLYFLMVFYCLQATSDCAVVLSWAAYKTRGRASLCLQEFMSNVNKPGSQRRVGAEAEGSEEPGRRLWCGAKPGPSVTWSPVFTGFTCLLYATPSPWGWVTLPSQFILCYFFHFLS